MSKFDFTYRTPYNRTEDEEEEDEVENFFSAPPKATDIDDEDEEDMDENNLKAMTLDDKTLAQLLAILPKLDDAKLNCRCIDESLCECKSYMESACIMAFMRGLLGDVQLKEISGRRSGKVRNMFYRFQHVIDCNKAKGEFVFAFLKTLSERIRSSSENGSPFHKAVTFAMRGMFSYVISDPQFMADAKIPNSIDRCAITDALFKPTDFRYIISPIISPTLALMVCEDAANVVVAMSILSNFEEFLSSAYLSVYVKAFPDYANFNLAKVWSTYSQVINSAHEYHKGYFQILLKCIDKLK